MFIDSKGELKAQMASNSAEQKLVTLDGPVRKRSGAQKKGGTQLVVTSALLVVTSALLVVTSALLVVTSALLVVTRSY